MIRPAVCADAPGIYTLICALEETRFPQEIFAWGLDTMLGSPSHILLVSEEQGDIVGLFHMRMEFQLHHCGKVVEILELIVSREVRSKGIGAALLESCQSTGGAAALHSV